MSDLTKQKEIIETLSFIEDKDDRFAYIIDLSKSLPPLADEYKTDTYRIEGCVSNLWLHSYEEENKLYFNLDADAIITKGIGALMVEIYSGLPPQAILDLDTSFLSEVGITQHLTPNRRNGLANLIAKIQSYAQAAL